jgi:hypothetical protein
VSRPMRWPLIPAGNFLARIPHCDPTRRATQCARAWILDRDNRGVRPFTQGVAGCGRRSVQRAGKIRRSPCRSTQTCSRSRLPIRTTFSPNHGCPSNMMVKQRVVVHPFAVCSLPFESMDEGH